MPEPIVIATWSFGQTAVQAALPLLQEGATALDAVLAGTQAVEDDPAVNSVGFGGLPNRIGTVQLDACVMDGKTLACGAVAGVENIRHPAALARRVMEKTPHVLLVGDGARSFALQEGFPLETLTTPASLAAWEQRRRSSSVALPGGAEDHDTVTVLALDRQGSLGGACSTSGLAHKLPGRVGDSPLIGAGLYVDDTAGAGGGTGVGEEIIRVGGSLLIVEALRAGRSPQQACELAIRRVNTASARRGARPAGVSFLALDPQGRHGGACTAGAGFQYAVGSGGTNVELRTARELGPEDR